MNVMSVLILGAALLTSPAFARLSTTPSAPTEAIDTYGFVVNTNSGTFDATTLRDAVLASAESGKPFGDNRSQVTSDLSAEQ